jgi:uncharacterized protein YjbK
MSQNLEIEFKNMINEDEFNQLKTYLSLSDKDFILQQNDYFDTRGFALKQLGCALRIRKKLGLFEFTLKEPQPIGLLETNEALSNEQVSKLLQNQEFPKGSISQRIHDLNIDSNSIVYFGTLQTLRAEVPYQGGLLVLDKSSYLGKTDYELEYEVEDPISGEQHFLQLLKKHAIPIRKSENKVARFYSEKKQQFNF